MSEDIKIGVVVADYEEYLPFAEAAAALSPEPYCWFSKSGISFELKTQKRTALVLCTLCGIGKVNAAAAAAHLAGENCDIIISFGLSGGLDGIGLGGITIADRFLEHDFDLTAIGYKPCEKPGQKYIYEADGRLLRILRDILPDAVCGTAVSGDRFVCDDADRRFLKDSFNAVSCDMETAAVAAVCDMAGIPFVALRRISDDAGDDAGDSYREMNDSGETLLADAVLRCITAIADSGADW